MDTKNTTPDPIQSNQPQAVPLSETPASPAPPAMPGPASAEPMATPPSPPSSQSGNFPGRTLGIVGFVLAFFFPLVGLILSIIAASKAKKAGVKFGLATAGIIVSAVFLVLGALFAVLVITTAKNIQDCAGVGNSKVGCDDTPSFNQTSSAGTTTKTYTATNLSFQYPANWAQADTSKAQYFAPDGAYDTYDLFYSPTTTGSVDKSAGIAVYSVQKATNPTSYTHAAAVTAMKSNVEKMKTFNGNGRDTGHGCASNWKLTEGPTYQEVDQLVGMTYSYTCTSPYSGPIHGNSGVWYDQTGSIHRLDVSAVDSCYDTNSAAIDAIVPSVRQ